MRLVATYYKIVELKGTQLRFLYHGVNKSKEIEKDKIYEADVKWVRDGSSYPYKSGFHVFDNRETAEKYLKKFKDMSKKRIIVPVSCGGVRSKGPRTEVLLAEKIKFN